MASKYASIVQKLPLLPPEDAKYQEKIDQLKQAIREQERHTPESLAKSYILARKGENPSPTIQDVEDATIGFSDDVDDRRAVWLALIRLLGKEGIEALLYECQQIVTAYEQMLAESHDQDETGWGQYGASPNTVKLASGGSVSVQVEPQGKVGDREKFRQWCIDNGYEHALALPWQTMNAVTKLRLTEGKNPPDGVVAGRRSKIVFRQG